MKKLFYFFHEHFLLRRITAAVAGVVAGMNSSGLVPEITPEQQATVALVIGNGTAFVFECLQKWVRLKFIKPAPVAPTL